MIIKWMSGGREIFPSEEKDVTSSESEVEAVNYLEEIYSHEKGLFHRIINYLDDRSLYALQLANKNYFARLDTTVQTHEIARRAIQILDNSIFSLGAYSSSIKTFLDSPLVPEWLTKIRSIILDQTVLEQEVVTVIPSALINNKVLGALDMWIPEELPQQVTSTWIRAKEICEKWYVVVEIMMDCGEIPDSDINYLENPNLYAELCAYLNRLIANPNLELHDINASNLFQDPELLKALNLDEEIKAKLQSHLEILNAKKTEDIEKFWSIVELSQNEDGIVRKLDLSSFHHQHSFYFLPDDFDGLEDLVELKTGSHQFFDLPQAIGDLQNLKVLDVGGNLFYALPSSIGKLENLEVLNVGNNQYFYKFPPEIEKLEKLKTLRMINTPRCDVSEIRNLKNLTSLDISHNGLKKFPKELKNFQALQELNISNNEICEFFTNLGQLSSLQSLDISNNKLCDFSPGSQICENLTTLDISNNKFDEFSEGIGSLTNLTKLVMKENGLYEWPHQITSLQNLQELDVSGNGFPTFPRDGVARLRNLKNFKITGNNSSLRTSQIRMRGGGWYQLPPRVGRLVHQGNGEYAIPAFRIEPGLLVGMLGGIQIPPSPLQSFPVEGPFIEEVDEISKNEVLKRSREEDSDDGPEKKKRKIG